MTIHQALKQFLDQACSVGNRVYPIILPADCTLPAITYQEIGNTPFFYLDGASVDTSRFQVAIWSSSVALSQRIALQVDKLNGFTGRLGCSADGPCVFAQRLNKFDLPEPETKKFRVIMEFSFSIGSN